MYDFLWSKVRGEDISLTLLLFLNISDFEIKQNGKGTLGDTCHNQSSFN